jgi:AAA+ superfamily predicted ATPase
VLVDDSDSETPLINTRVKLAARIAQYLVGKDVLPGHMQLRPATFPLPARSLVSEQVRDRIKARGLQALLAREPIVVEIVGAPGSGRRLFAEEVARSLGHGLLVVDIGATPPDQVEETLAAARREACLADAVLCVANWEAHLPHPTPRPEDPEHGPPPSRPRQLPSFWRRFFTEGEETVIVTAEEREGLLDQVGPAIVHVSVPFPTPSQRAELFAEALARAGSTAEPGVDLVAVARRFALTPARIEAAARGALELAAERDPDRERVSATDLTEACRHQLRHDLQSLASRVTASHKWEDLVIPVDVYHAMREMVAYVKHGQRVYDEWGFGARHSLAQGVSALFAGPPGTGKTMCASVMARELDMELFRVDLSRVVSKWIGETEKNLAKVFDEAQRSNAIILFDEADALFAKRTEVKSSVDRYANLEVNFLLQRMEAFSGVTILTTNFEDTIDTAFKRRLTFRMRFEKPDATARAALWRKVFPENCQRAGDIDYERLGQMYEMSGGNIRNAALRAAFLAAADEKGNRIVDMELCMLAAERECREMGLLIRSATPAELTAEAAPFVGEAPPPRPAPVPAPAPEVFDKSAGTPPRMIPISHPRKRG